MQYKEIFETAVKSIKAEQETRGIDELGRTKVDDLLANLPQKELILIRDAADMVRSAAIFSRVTIATSEFERAMMSIRTE